METEKKRRAGAWVIAAAAACLFFYISSLQTQIREAKASQKSSEKEIQELSGIQSSEAMKRNREFLKRFFTYQSVKERYQAVKPLMTAQGFEAVQPSGWVLSDSKESVKSSIFGLKPYELEVNKKEADFFNEFKLTIDYKGISSTETTIVKTSLLYVEKEGWRIDDVQFIGQLTKE